MERARGNFWSGILSGVNLESLTVVKIFVLHLIFLIGLGNYRDNLIVE